jgi:hypothetical protein
MCPWTDVCRDVSADPVAMTAAQLGFPRRPCGGRHVDKPFLPVRPRRDTPPHTTAHLAQPLLSTLPSYLQYTCYRLAACTVL